ncbi:uncharacterized protein LOC116007306 isoform X3 [Ipomoea triloba]|uniref:uncharacterized protein LOC116007306 isoform X3 n=1 Tax=Ipomoea triloba TaxID=35885 RepID=UPI00125DA855|nr:uncharacterized protein LOC116007306 isoform X3 [Ipomoea triloba]
MHISTNIIWSLILNMMLWLEGTAGNLGPDLLMQLISLISSFVMIIKTGRLTAKEAMAHPYSFQVRAAENSREQLGKKMNGFAKEEKGLYYLINPPTKKTSVFYDFVHCNNVSIHTWHNRLGHFPVNKMHLLDGVQCSRIKMN